MKLFNVLLLAGVWYAKRMAVYFVSAIGNKE